MIKSELVDRISVQNPLLYGRGETCAAHRLCQSARDVMVARTRCSNNEQQIGKVCKRSRRRFFHSHGDARRYDGPVCPRFGKLSGALVGGVVL